jgi:hypothetical protein
MPVKTAGKKRKRGAVSSGPVRKKSKNIRNIAARAVRDVMMRNIETKQSNQTISDGTEIAHNNFVTLSSNLLATTQGLTDPQTASTNNRIGDQVTALGVKIAMMVELNERYSDVTFRLMVVKSARGDTPTRATLFNGQSGNKMLDTINLERYSILAQKWFKITAQNAAGNSSVGVSGFNSLNDVSIVMSRATKIVKLWIPGEKFVKSRIIKYDDNGTQAKFFDYHCLLYAYSNYTTQVFVCFWPCDRRRAGKRALRAGSRR